jgi:hypothetical protein
MAMQTTINLIGLEYVQTIQVDEEINGSTSWLIIADQAI